MGVEKRIQDICFCCQSVMDKDVVRKIFNAEVSANGSNDLINL